MIGVIGGSGLYRLFESESLEHKASTPYGDPSDVITVAQVGGRRFCPGTGSGTGIRHIGSPIGPTSGR